MKVFDKILDAISETRIYTKVTLECLADEVRRNYKQESDLHKIIAEQNKIINDLINNIYSQDTSLETVMIIPYRGNPKLFKDGKRLDTDKMTGFDINWSWDGRAEVTVRND